MIMGSIGLVCDVDGVVAHFDQDTQARVESRDLPADTGGTTLAGRSRSSRTGQITGTPRVTLVRPNAKGVYAVRVPAHAAAILTLSA
jgi:hypothetical protein